MRRFLACMMIVLALAMAGCSGGATSGARTGMVSAQQIALAWAPDATLILITSTETNAPLTAEEIAELEEEASEDMDSESMAKAYVEFVKRTQGHRDSSLLDGKTAAWAYIYVSVEEEELLALIVDAGGSVVAQGTQDLPGLSEDLEDFSLASTSDWKVDAPAAAAVVRANVTGLDEVLALQGLEFDYDLDFEDGAWSISGYHNETGWFLWVSVDMKTGELQEVEFDPSDLPIEIGNLTPKPTGERILPEPIDEMGSMSFSFDPLNFATLGPCSTPTASCDTYEFVAHNPLEVSAMLSWGLPSNDFDLYMFDAAGTQVMVSGQTPPGTSESFSTTVEAGVYEVVVVGWAVTSDTYRITVDFA